LLYPEEPHFYPNAEREDVTSTAEKPFSGENEAVAVGFERLSLSPLKKRPCPSYGEFFCGNPNGSNLY
jgi:hypothetical protein